MNWIKSRKKLASIVTLAIMAIVIYSCRISIGLAPISSIDYSKVKTISIAEFQNQADYVYAPLAIEFNQRLKDEKLEFDKLTLCISNRTRIAYFRAQDGLLEKKRNEIS